MYVAVQGRVVMGPIRCAVYAMLSLYRELLGVPDISAG